MSKAQREEFLAGVHVGIIAVDEPGRGPLALPVWYLYRNGCIDIFTDADSLKGRLAAAAGRATFTVQQEALPYQYVSVEGPIEIVHTDESILETAVRYLGPELGRQYTEANDAPQLSTLLRITPEHWRTFSYGRSTI